MSASIDASPPVEVLAEALCFRARALLASGVDATADLDRLEALCEAHRAGVTRSIVRVLREGATHGVWRALAEGFTLRARPWAEARYTLGIEGLREDLLPIPIPFTAPRCATGTPPKPTSTQSSSSPAWPGGRAPTLRRTRRPYYGLRIGQRLHGESAVAALERHLCELTRDLDEDARAVLLREVERRAEARSR